MSFRLVHWHEGMFLRPHHLQAMERHRRYMTQLSQSWDVHHNWGLREIALDENALANFRIVVRNLKARLRDGTIIAVPEEGNLPVVEPQELKAAFARQNTLTIYVGVPVFSLSRPNAAEDTGAGVRFLIDSQEIEDENTGGNPQPLQVRLLNLKVLLSTQDHSGYDVLPIARIEKSPKAEATPQLDLTYIPPILACDAWSPLWTNILQAIYDRIGKKIELLATQVVSRGITFDSQAQGDAMIFNQLRVLNEAYALLEIGAYTPGIHPLPAFMELCRIVGQLSIFGATRRPPQLPKYDHDDLGTTFYRVKQYIDALLDIFVEPEYKERPFVGAGLRMQVALEPAWLESAWHTYIGVMSPMDPEETIRMVTKPGQLDMKVSSSERVDLVFRQGQAGLKFTHSPRPPRALPALPGLVYFQVSRDPPAEWQAVQRSLSMAIRINENLVASDIQGQRVLTIKTGGGQTTTLQFTLYIVGADKV